VRTLLLGVALMLLGIPGLLIANAHRPEFNCGASVTACEQGQALTAIPGRFSESTYDLVQALAYGVIALGVLLMLVGVILLVTNAQSSES
jgi:hypothetical protein